MLSKAIYDNYTAILKEELMPAMGCTEPIAIAYAAAKARAVLGKIPEKIHVSCSGNIIKNVKGVIVPNSGNQKGIEAAAILGAVGGDENKALEVIANATDEARALTKKLVSEKICDTSLAENVPNLFIEVEAEADNHKSLVRIENHHTDITLIKLDGRIIFENAPQKIETPETSNSNVERNLMTLAGIIDYANELNINDVKEILDRQIEANSKISQEGLDNKWGARVGKTILENWGSDVRSRACARAAAGSDARMSGCPLPVIINSGSGNQ